MLKALEPFTMLLTTAVVGIVLVLFRKQVARLVDWIVTLRRIEKTKEGYAVEAGKPDAPILASEKQEQAIAAVEAAEVVSGTPVLAASATAESWFDLMFERKFEEAVALLQHEAETAADPEQRLTSRSVIGYVRFQQNPADGVTYFEQLIQDYPAKLQPYQWYALTYLWNEMPERALAVLDRALAAVDQKASLLDTKSDCLVRLGRDEEAIAASTAGIAADSRIVANYLNLARIYERLGATDVARSWYERALDVSYNAVYVLEPYARFITSHGTPAEAIQCYRSLTAKQPRNFTYLTLLANAYLAAGFNSLALDAYMRANELASGNAGWILANIGNIYNNQGFHGEACKYLKLAVDREPDSQYAHERLAQAQKLETEEREKLTALLAKLRAPKQPPQLPEGAA